jgi:hypothetical protein
MDRRKSHVAAGPSERLGKNRYICIGLNVNLHKYLGTYICTYVCALKQKCIVGNICKLQGSAINPGRFQKESLNANVGFMGNKHLNKKTAYPK